MVPPSVLPYVLDFDRDLTGEITKAYERYAPSEEIAGLMASLNFGCSSVCPDVDLNEKVNWSNIQCDMQCLSEAVRSGYHWSDEDQVSKDILPAPSLLCPVEYIHLSQNKTLTCDDELSEQDKTFLEMVANKIEGNYNNTAFISNVLKSADSSESNLNTKSNCEDPYLPESVIEEADKFGINDNNPFDNLLVKRKLDDDKSFNTWKSIIKSYDPIEFASIQPDLILQWSFDLDDFQKQAIVELEKGNSVFVSAHTSAGKTVVAEYAVALTRSHGTRCIYCSPIKALSNQKYREFKDKFDEVGLVTGDIQLRSDAFFVIMTTEILRTMVYNSSEMIHELEWLIFDEVHYVNDLERGVVWEEILILIPPHVKFVMLSATVPNAVEFADWVGYTKRRQVRVISTVQRPVVLQHYIYLPSGDMFLLRSGEGQFLHKGYKDAMDCYQDRYRVRSSNKSKNVWTTFVQHIKGFQLTPLIIFVFSRNLCDEMAQMFGGTQDLLTDKEKTKVRNFMCRALKLIDEEDRTLTQIQFVTELSLNGIGVHHSGLLPILKEYVEFLFTNGLIKVLVATETFAMGVNMPARTVVFSSIRKFDGVSRRTLHAGEYTQMSGRAGRRGIDTSGVAIIVCERAPPSSPELSTMIQGAPLTLLSKFRLTFAICLKILRTTGFSMLKMLRNSFSEFSGVKQSIVAAHDYEETERMLNTEKTKLKESGLCKICESSHLNEYVKECASYWLRKSKLDPVHLQLFYNSQYNHRGRLIYVQPNQYYSMIPAVMVDCIHPMHKFVHVIIRSGEWSDFDELPSAVPNTEDRYIPSLRTHIEKPGGNDTAEETSSSTLTNQVDTLVSSDHISWLPGFSKMNNPTVFPLRIRDGHTLPNLKNINDANFKFVSVVFAKIPITRIQAFSKLAVQSDCAMGEYCNVYINRTYCKKMRDGSIIRVPHEREEFAYRCSGFLTRPDIIQWHKSIFLDPIRDLGLQNYFNCKEHVELNQILGKLIQADCLKCPDFINHFKRSLTIWCYEERMDKLRSEMSDGRLELLDEYKRRLK
ncbi:hypothetical protein GJ496_000156, partial [Pomphorhynchus laevis]